MSQLPKKPKKLTAEEFQKLKDKWYLKLKKSGFHDIEYNDTLFINGKTTEFHKKEKFVHGTWEADRDYYIMAEQFLHAYAFDRHIDKVIWEYHSNGLGVRAIASTLQKAGIKKMRKSSVWLIISRLKKIMLQMNHLDFREENVQ